jgi:peptidoglycan hydrolase-like protein with peptidoglycan-binding domain
MSNLLRSKLFLGVVIVAVLVVAGAATAGAYTHSVTLKMGSTGSQVMSLQQALNSNSFLVSATGAGSPGMESTYFGAKTKAAVMAFQSARGLSVDGVVGPMTGAALSGTVSTGGLPAGCTSTSGYSTTTGLPCSGGSSLPAGCTSTAGYSPTTGAKCDGSTGGSTPTGPLTGGAGSITITALSDFGDEEVGEGDEDVEVLAFEVEADDESDVEITSVKVELSQESAADSEDLLDYAASVAILMNGEVVGESDAEDFSENNDIFTDTISLDGAVVRAGETEEFSVAISALGNLDSGDINSDDWQVGVSSVRFVDGEGVVSTESLTLDIGDNVLDDTLEEQFNFADFATAQDVELQVALNDDEDDVNEAHVIDIDDTDDTDDVEILAFTLEAEGSDLNVSEIPVIFTTVEAAGAHFDDPDDIVSTARLWMDGDVLATESFLTTDADGDTETITFDDLDIDVGEGDVVELMVTVDVQDLATGLDEADTLMAQITGTEVDLIEAEDESGEDLAAADLVGTALGEASAFYDTGIMVEFVSASATRSSVADAAGEFDQGQFEITFDVTAFEADMRIDRSCEEGGGDAAGQGVEYTITNAANNATTCNVSSTSSDSEDTANTYEVDEDTTRRITLTVNASVTATGGSDDHFAEVSLDSINWGTATDDTNANYYTFNLSDFKTTAIFLNEF